jgi:hypothetical protein
MSMTVTEKERKETARPTGERVGLKEKRLVGLTSFLFPDKAFWHVQIVPPLN